jgi:pilus assembly protein CpaE
MEAKQVMAIPLQITDSSAAIQLSVALIDANDQHRREVAIALAAFQGTTVREYSTFPASLDDLPQMMEKRYDAVIIGLDSDPEYAFDVVESICDTNSATVMVYSEQAQLEQAIRFMRAGAREYLTLPLAHTDMAGALARVSISRSAISHGKRISRKMFVFLGVKGGCGVTTISSNFAVALAQVSGQRTLLIDLGLPLGDAALNLGMITQYSTTNALQDFSRLDASFFRSLLTRHSSGLSVLAAPGEFFPALVPAEALDKLLAVARQCFDYVVVDAGSRIDLKDTSLFDENANIYLISQVGISELRNANRMVTQFFSARGHKLQIVLNRYTPNALLFDEKQIDKALTRPAQWKIPDDFATARRTGSSSTPVVFQDSPIARAIRQMARNACGLPANPGKKKGFSLFRPFAKPLLVIPEPEEG